MAMPCSGHSWGRLCSRDRTRQALALVLHTSRTSSTPLKLVEHIFQFFVELRKTSHDREGGAEGSCRARALEELPSESVAFTARL